MNLSGADMQMQEMRDRLAAVTAERDALALELSHLRPEWQSMQAERDAAVSALRLATKMTTGSTSVMMRLDVWEAFLAAVDRYGADQWRNGNAGREPQEFLEWRQEQAADRRAAFNSGEI